MAMPSGHMVISDKTRFPNGGGIGTAGGATTGSTVGWYPDERDEFISWLRGEFAAANAIIDSLLHHLKSVSEPGEYDAVIASIQQRRCNWNPVLHMQQYFSVAEVIYSLQQATCRRQQLQNRGGFYDPVKIGGPGKEYKRSNSSGFRPGQGQGHRIVIPVNEGHNSTAEFKSPRGIANGSSNHEKDVTLAKYNNDGHSDADLEKDSSSSTKTSLEKHANIAVMAKTFVGTETVDGKKVNVVDGMTMYEKLFDDSEVSNMVTLVNDLRTAGKQGQFQGGQTYVVSKKPMKGHGREMIQLGLPLVDDVINGASKDRRTEPIPNLFQDVIDRLIAMQILTVKPDSCIIDIYNQGDYSHPHLWPHNYGRPVCVLLLTDCDMTFGKVIGVDHPGDYRGSVSLSLSPGSMLVMEGRSADIAKHAIPSIQKQRVLVTLTKSKRITHGGAGPGGGARSKQYVLAPTTSVLAVQPIFLPAPPVSAGWTGGPMRQHPPPGTGVFLPSGSGNSRDQQPDSEEKCAGKNGGENGERDCNGGDVEEGRHQKQNVD